MTQRDSNAMVHSDAYVLFYLRKDVQPEIFKNPPPFEEEEVTALPPPQPQEEAGNRVTVLQD